MFYDGAVAAAQAGVRTGGDARNRAHLAGKVVCSGIDDATEALAFDPQTSGGLLAAVTPEDATALVGSGVGFVDVGGVEAGRPAVELRGGG
jgi:selenide,water dikinase